MNKNIQRRLREDAYHAMKLDATVDRRTPLLQYEIPLDDELMASIVRDVRHAPNAGKRVGAQWFPKDMNRIKKKEGEDDNWATPDELKALNDACTKFCTSTYFPDAFARVNMIANVTRVYDHVAAVAKLPVKLVFKGGVMLRLVLLEFLHDLPADARGEAIQYLQSHKGIGYSDFDFEMVPDDHAPPPEVAHRQILVNYAVLLWIQKQMQIELEGKKKTPGPGLLHLEWDRDEARARLKRMLQEAVDEIEDDAHALHKAHIDEVFLSDEASSRSGYKTKSDKALPSQRSNVAIFECVGADKCVLSARELFDELQVRGVPARSGGHCLYATLNTYIGEGAEQTRPPHLTGVFHLARIKHTFVCHYTTKKGEKRIDRLGGEMIDLSQSHGVHTDLNRAFLYEHAARDLYRDYPILGVDPKEVVLRSYTPEGFYLDHATMVHHTDVEPWRANKLGKRLLRYAAFFMAHVLGPRVEGTRAAKMGALRRLADALRSPAALQAATRSVGLREVDVFLRRERAALAAAQAGDKRAAAAYLRTLHGHLEALVRVFEGAQRFAPYKPHIDSAHISTVIDHLRSTSNV